VGIHQGLSVRRMTGVRYRRGRRAARGPGAAIRRGLGLGLAGGAGLAGLTWLAAGGAARAGAGLVQWSARRPRFALTGLAGAAYALALGFVIQQQIGREQAADTGLECLALNIYHEARGEPEAGKLAVGQVVLNRVADSRFPDAICTVIKEGGERPFGACQFSWWCDGRTDRPGDRPAWDDSVEIARRILAGSVKDPTGGALWYHADYVKPAWRFERTEAARIGRHVFYAPPKPIAAPKLP
jgi:hypothetical protein